MMTCGQAISCFGLVKRKIATSLPPTGPHSHLGCWLSLRVEGRSGASSPVRGAKDNPEVTSQVLQALLTGAQASYSQLLQQ